MQSAFLMTAATTWLLIASGTAGAADLPSSNRPYDASWYAADLWSRETPDGFVVHAPLTIAIRPKDDPAAPRAISCRLDPADYHPGLFGNQSADAISRQLHYRSYTKKITADVSQAYTAVMQDGEHSVSVEVRKGDHWTYLVWGEEGAYLIELNGHLYGAIGQELVDHSTVNGKPADGMIGNLDPAHYQEWLNLPCANGVRGWLFMPDLVGVAGITLG
jgi:hypothetical protein